MFMKPSLCLKEVRPTFYKNNLKEARSTRMAGFRMKSGLDTATVAPSQILPVHGEAAWNTIFGFASNDYSGYAGEWLSWGRDDIDAHSQQPARSFRALRLFKTQDAGGESIKHKNIYGLDVPFGDEEKRSDGNFEKSWHFNKKENLSEDGFFHPFVSCTGALRYRALSLTDDCYVGHYFALPYEEHVAATNAAGEPLKAWFSESFLKHDNKRWSITPRYLPESNSLAAFMQIREFWTEGAFDDTQQIDLKTLPLIKPAAGPLPEDPSEWLVGGAWEGTQAKLTFEADGSIERLPLEACMWVAPKPDVPGSSLFLLVDSCYAFVPTELPHAASAEGPLRLEVGVMADACTFKRNITEYDGLTGMIRSITHQVYRKDS